jgi:hypothetical protein
LQVAFDPLDGSSIFSANFAVGSIFGIWKGSSPVGQTGRDQVAAAYSIYGPRTLLVVAVPSASAAGAAGSCSTQNGQQQQQQQQAGPTDQQQQPAQMFDVLEFALSEGKGWKLRQVFSKLGNSKNIAPANIKAAKDNAVYEQLVLKWISNGCKLRYSGGMVPDIHHIMAKVRGCVGEGWLAAFGRLGWASGQGDCKLAMLWSSARHTSHHGKGGGALCVTAKEVEAGGNIET